MPRTPSQKRYCAKHAKTLCVGTLRRVELEELRAMKRKSGRTWLELLYRGLGVRREDVLNSLRLRGSGNTR